MRAHIKRHAENRGVGMGPPADPVSRLEADDSVARQSKCPCGRDTRRPCADDNDVKVKHRTLDSHLVPRSIGLTLMKSGEK